MLTLNLALAAFCGVAFATAPRLTQRQAAGDFVDPSKNYINATSKSTESVVLSVSTRSSERNATSPLLYGWMVEGTLSCCPAVHTKSITLGCC